MTKITSFFNNSKFLLFLLCLMPLYAQAEAGKSLDGGEILLSLLFLVFMLVHQVYLTIVSFQRIISKEHKSTKLHYLSMVISIVACFVYFSDSETHEMGPFGWIVLIPCLLGLLSMAIEYGRNKKE